MKIFNKDIIYYIVIRNIDEWIYIQKYFFNYNIDWIYKITDYELNISLIYSELKFPRYLVLIYDLKTEIWQMMNQGYNFYNNGILLGSKELQNRHKDIIPSTCDYRNVKIIDYNIVIRNKKLENILEFQKFGIFI